MRRAACRIKRTARRLPISDAKVSAARMRSLRSCWTLNDLGLLVVPAR